MTPRARLHRGAARGPADRARRGARRRARGREPHDRGRGDLAPSRGRPAGRRRDRDRGPRLLNGTFVNAVRIDGATRLAGGDSVKLGQSVLQVEAAAAPATVVAASRHRRPPPTPAQPPRLGRTARRNRSAPTPRPMACAARGIASRQLVPKLVLVRDHRRDRRRARPLFRPTLAQRKREIQDHGHRHEHEDPDRRAARLALRVRVEQRQERRRPVPGERRRGDVVGLRLGDASVGGPGEPSSPARSGGQRRGTG